MKACDSPWIQGIEKMIKTAGFGNVLTDTSSLSPTFHKVFFTRLKDQYIQSFIDGDKSSCSKSLSILADIKEKYEISKYLKLPYNVSKLSALRCNTSILNASRASFIKGVVSPNCLLCNEEETLHHFLLTCKKFQNERSHLFSKLNVSFDFKHLDKKQQLSIILNCATEKTHTKNLNSIQKDIISYINRIYKIRENM